MATIHWLSGQHAQDLVSRDIISPHWTWEHLVIIPITKTWEKILHLLEHEGVKQPKILNFAGVMMTSPNAVPNIHFLFWPGASKNLRVATAGNDTHLQRKVLDKAETRGIKIIETTRIEHDSKMAIIQWLAHLFLLLVWEISDPEIKQELIDPWKTTTGTIVDMIFHNSFAEEVAIEFFDALPGNGGDPFVTFLQVVDRHLTTTDIEKFSTPNFDRVLTFASKGKRLHLSPARVAMIRKKLNTEGRKFLSERVNELRASKVA
jgi:hypothetical protein